MSTKISFGMRLTALCIALSLCCQMMVTAAESSAQKAATPAPAASEVPYVEGQQPPAAPACQKYCLKTIPAVYKTVCEQVQVCPATTRTKVIPAVYGTKKVEVMVKPAMQCAVWVPAVWKTECVKRMTQEASTTYRIIPATFKCVPEVIEVQSAYEKGTFTPATLCRSREKVMVCPESTKIQTKCGPCGSQKAETIKIPAKYASVRKYVIKTPEKVGKCPVPAVKKTFTTRKIATPAKVEEVKIPACYETIQRKVLVKNGYYKMTTIPAKFRTICVNTIVKPATTEAIPVPATFKTVKRCQLVTPAKKVWRLVKDRCPRCRPANPCGGCR